jgi:hypothetical protein
VQQQQLKQRTSNNVAIASYTSSGSIKKFVKRMKGQGLLLRNGNGWIVWIRSLGTGKIEPSIIINEGIDFDISAAEEGDDDGSVEEEVEEVIPVTIRFSATNRGAVRKVNKYHHGQEKLEKIAKHRGCIDQPC